MQKPSFLQRPLAKILFFEITGTLFFIYGIALSQLKGYPGDVFVSASLFLAICWAGQLTGGHFNPAVTVGIRIANGLKQSWAYIVAQYIGAFVGALLAYYISRSTITPDQPSNAKQMIADVFAELVGTFTFVLSILIVTTKSTSFAKKTLYIYTFIPISLFICRRLSDGAGVNPAITMMGSLVNLIFNNGTFKYVWIQTIPPIFGAMFAGIFFKFFYLPMSNYNKTSKRVSS